MSKSYKVAVIAKGERGPSYNGMRYPTADLAEKAGADLYSRWFAVESYKVEPSDDEPNVDAAGNYIAKPAV